MRILTVFYSLDGNCRALAEVIHGAVGGEAEALRPMKVFSRKGVRRFLECCKMAFFGQSSPNHPLAANIAGYDLVFVGTPVWAWHIAPPVLRFLSETDCDSRKMALYALSGGTPGWTLRAMRKLVEARGGQVVSMASFRDLRQKQQAATRERAAAWAKEAVRLAERARIPLENA